MRPLFSKTYNGKEFHIEGTEDALYANGVRLKVDRCGFAASAFDGRHILVAFALIQGKTFWESDVVFAAFDTQTNLWREWMQNLFVSQDSGAKKNLLWLRHASGDVIPTADEIDTVGFNGAVSPTGYTFGSMAYSPERPSVKSPQPSVPMGLSPAPGVDIASTDFLAETLDVPPESFFGEEVETPNMEALAGYGIPGGIDLSGPAPVQSTTPASIPGEMAPLSPVDAPAPLSPVSAPAPQMPSGSSMTMSPEARPSMTAPTVPGGLSMPTVSAPSSQQSVPASTGLMSTPAPMSAPDPTMQTMFDEPVAPSTFSSTPSIPTTGSLSPTTSPSAMPTMPSMPTMPDPLSPSVAPVTTTPVQSTDAIFSAPTAATIMNPYGSGMPQPAEFSTGFTPQVVEVGTPPTATPATPPPAATMPAAAPAPASPAPPTSTAPPLGAPAPAPTFSTATPTPAPTPAPSSMPAPPSIPTVSAPSTSIPTVGAPAPSVPGAMAPSVATTTAPPQARGLTAPPSMKDLPGLAIGGLLGGLPGAVMGVAAPRVMGSIGNLFGGMGGSAVPMGTSISVQQVGPGQYATSLGNVVDVSGNPADVMKQPGGAEALAAAGAQSLADSGLHESGGVSQEAQEAMASGAGGLW